MAASYLRTQNVLVILVCILAVAGSAWYVAHGSMGSRTTTNSKEDNRLNVIQTSGAPLSTSTDWRKQFYTNASTSVFVNSTTDPETIDGELAEPETVTGQFGRKFFEHYMLLKQNNLTEDPDAVKAVIDQSLENLISAAPQARVYSVRETIPSSGSDSASIRTYANAIGAILTTHMPADDAAITAMTALEEEDRGLVSTIEKIARAYALMRDAVLTVPVPSSLTTYHVHLINGLSNMAFVSDGMTKVFSDPIQGIVAVASYEKSVVTLRDALLDYKYYFTQQGMQFSGTESGVVFARIQ